MFRFLDEPCNFDYVSLMTSDPVRILLNEELERRRLRNSAYSLRALARDLKVSLTALSDVLNGKRQLSKRNVEKVSEALMLSPERREALAKTPIKEMPEPEPYELLTEDVFKLIGEWHYFAILNLAKLKGAKSSPDWIAKRLGLDTAVVEEALDRLKRLGFVNTKAGKLYRTARPFETTHDIPSVAIRKHHLGSLRMAEDALLNEPVGRREFGSTIMPMNLEQMEAIKRYLKRTRERVSEMAEKGSTTEVFCLSIQLFPLTKKGESK